MNFAQARWDEPLIYERSRSGKVGHTFACATADIQSDASRLDQIFPRNLLRDAPPPLPEVSEVEVLRHFTRLSEQNYSVDLGIYPLGSCTMKYNPKICEMIASSHKIAELHPYQARESVQGILRILYELSQMLSEIVGLRNVSLVPSAGAHGELVGALIIRAYHKYEGGLERDEVIVPDSAHGTNPASAAMAGFNVVEVPSDENGFVDLESLKSVVSRRTAGLMITNPNTLGLFDPNILEIAEIVHEAGGLLYYDGANLNAILGKARPGDSGFDIVHMNLHKTFATPHGGGGPGAGPLAVTDDLAKFLPVPTVEFNGSEYYLNFERPHTIGRVRGFYGNIAVLLRAYVYILMLGPEGLRQAAELSVLNANYLASKIAKVKGFAIAFNSSVRCKHEFVVSASRLAKETGVTALHVSKRLLDLGFHAPTVYFPLIVDEALMIEPTETVSKEDLDSFAEAFSKISDEAYSDPVRVMSAPQQTSVTRIDEIKASHPKTLCLSWRQARMKQSKPSASPIKVV